MSRFVECIDGLGERPISLAGLVGFCSQVASRLEAERTRCAVDFTWFRRVKAPVSGMESFNPHSVRWVANWFEAGKFNTEKPCVELQVKVSVKALCPCSKVISDRGAHNQRSTVTVTVLSSAATDLPELNLIVSMVESHASAPVYPLLKRADEKFVTERAYDHPVFVEDLVRAVANSLGDMPGIESWKVHVRNHESIHAHDCFAEIHSS
jgi:GTP cyclohydrolase FolE2